MAVKWSAKPSLVIGLGGTGIKTATLIKKDLLEIGDNYLPGEVAIVGFDTEKNNRFKAGGWGKKRESGTRSTGPVELAAGEYVYLGGNVRQYARDVKSGQYPHIHKWWRVESYLEEGLPDNLWDLNEGAGQYPQFGRIALVYHLSDFRNMVGRHLRDIRRLTNQKNVNIHVIGSLAGGTGRGMFIDVAYLAKQIAAEVGLVEARVFGYYALVDAFLGTPQVNLGRPQNRMDFESRCLAALRELGRLQTTLSDDHPYPMIYDPRSVDPILNGYLEKPPYDMIYLFDGSRTVNTLDHVVIEHGIGPTIADAVVTQIDAQGGTDITAHVVNVIRMRDTMGIDKSVPVVGTIGAYSIHLPIFHWVERWTHRLAQGVLGQLLQPSEFDTATGVPLKLHDARRGGQTSASGREYAVQELNQARQNFTEFLEYIWQIGKRYTDDAQRANVLMELNGYTVEDWFRRMDPDVLGKENVERSKLRALKVLKADLTKREVIKGEPNEYYVEPNPGGNDQQRSGYVRDEIRGKLNRLLGAEREDGRREGGDFRGALEGYKAIHLNRFSSVILQRAADLLNGLKADKASEARAGKLGFVIAMIEAIRNHFRAAAVALGGIDSSLRSGSQPRPWWSSAPAQSQWIEAARSLNEKPTEANRKKYIKAAQGMLELHKADLARRVAQEIANELIQILEDLLGELSLWRQILATNNETQGGVYALVLRGDKDNLTDLEESKKVRTRWIIDDSAYFDEQYDKYIGADRQQAMEDMLGSFQWNIHRSESGKMRVECSFKGEPLRKEPGEGPGQRNAQMLLDQCRKVFTGAWDDLSVSHYLVSTYKDKIDVLKDRLLHSNEALLSVKSKDQTLPAYFLRIEPKSRSDAELQPDSRNFTDLLMQKLAAELKIDTVRELPPGVEVEGDAKKQQFVGDSHSQDRFKLTLLYFLDLVKLSQIASYDEMARKYRSFPRNREYLHILAAEQNALHYEQKLDKQLHQHPRELDNRVVMLLEDIETFKLAARCLVYGDNLYPWNRGEQRFLLYLAKAMGENNANEEAYWLTAVPSSGRAGLGRLSSGNKPESWQLTPSEAKASLVKAMDNFVFRGKDVKNATLVFKDAQLGYARLVQTLSWAMDEDRTYRLDKNKMFCEIPEWLEKDKDGKRLRNVYSQVAQLRTYQQWLEYIAEPKLNEYAFETQPGKQPRSPEDQCEADLWTVLYLIIQEEALQLQSQIEVEKVELLLVPEEEFVKQPKPVMPDRQPVPDNVISEVAPGKSISTDMIKCPHCSQMHPQDTTFCPKTGKPLEEQIPEGMRHCPHCSQMHPLDTMFCPKTGKPLEEQIPTGMLRCPHCDEMHTLDTMFCPKTGKSI